MIVGGCQRDYWMMVMKMLLDAQKNKVIHNIVRPLLLAASAAAFYRGGGLGQVDSVGDKHVAVRGVLVQRRLRSLEERHLHLGCVLGGGLEVGYGLGALGLAPLGHLGLGHAALGFPVDLVADDHEGEVLRVAGVGLGEELFSPGVQLLEGLLGGDVVHQDAGIRTAVERNAQTLEALLAGSVPNLKERRRRATFESLGTKQSRGKQRVHKYKMIHQQSNMFIKA
jgi:hypothetical protein